MKLIPTVALCVGGLYLLSKLSSASAATRLNFVISDFKLQNAGLSPLLTINVHVQNPTNTSFLVSALVANCMINDTYVGNISGFKPTVIAAGAESIMPLNVLISAVGVLSDVFGLLTEAGQQAAVLQLQGTVNVDSLLLPLNVTYRLL